MSSLVAALQRFNRKERNWLIRDALGAGADTLCPSFRNRLSNVLRRHEPEISVPNDAWWATDFHIDWFIGALTLRRGGPGAIGHPQSNSSGIVTGDQQDIDLLVAWDTTVVMIEAKGVGSWSGTGTTAKLQRLNNLPESLFAGVSPYLVFTSPDAGGVPKENLPAWIKSGGASLHMQMKTPETGRPLLQVQRCEISGDDVMPKAVNDKQWRIITAKPLPKAADFDPDC